MDKIQAYHRSPSQNKGIHIQNGWRMNSSQPLSKSTFARYEILVIERSFRRNFLSITIFCIKRNPLMRAFISTPFMRYSSTPITAELKTIHSRWTGYISREMTYNKAYFECSFWKHRYPHQYFRVIKKVERISLLNFFECETRAFDSRLTVLFLAKPCVRSFDNLITCTYKTFSTDVPQAFQTFSSSDWLKARMIKEFVRDKAETGNMPMLHLSSK